MKICPKCKETYLNSFTNCEKCGAMLETKNNSMLSNTSSKPITTSEKKFEDIVRVHLKNMAAEQKAQTEKINTIKNCIVFFTILTVISLVFSIIAGVNILNVFGKLF